MEGKQTKKRKLRGKKNGNTQQRIPFSFRVKPPKSSSRRVPCDLPWSASLHSPVGFPGDAVVKNPPANAGDGRDAGSIPGLGGSPVEGNGNLLQYSCLKKKKSHGQRSLAGYSPWGRKESDPTEQVRGSTAQLPRMPSTHLTVLEPASVLGSLHLKLAPPRMLLHRYHHGHKFPFFRVFAQRQLPQCGPTDHLDCSWFLLQPLQCSLVLLAFPIRHQLPSPCVISLMSAVTVNCLRPHQNVVSPMRAAISVLSTLASTVPGTWDS